MTFEILYTHCHQVEVSLEACHIFSQALLVDFSFHLLKILPEEFSFALEMFYLMRHFNASSYFPRHLYFVEYIYIGYLKWPSPIKVATSL